MAGHEEGGGAMDGARRGTRENRPVTRQPPKRNCVEPWMAEPIFIARTIAECPASAGREASAIPRLRVGHSSLVSEAATVATARVVGSCLVASFLAVVAPRARGRVSWCLAVVLRRVCVFFCPWG